MAAPNIHVLRKLVDEGQYATEKNGKNGCAVPDKKWWAFVFHLLCSLDPDVSDERQLPGYIVPSCECCCGRRCIDLEWDGLEVSLKILDDCAFITARIWDENARPHSRKLAFDPHARDRTWKHRWDNARDKEILINRLKTVIADSLRIYNRYISK